MSILGSALAAIIGIAGALLLGTADEWWPEFRRDGKLAIVNYFRNGLATRRTKQWVERLEFGARDDLIKRLEHELGFDVTHSDCIPCGTAELVS